MIDYWHLLCLWLMESYWRLTWWIDKAVNLMRWWPRWLSHPLFRVAIYLRKVWVKFIGLVVWQLAVSLSLSLYSHNTTWARLLFSSLSNGHLGLIIDGSLVLSTKLLKSSRIWSVMMDTLVKSITFNFISKALTHHYTCVSI